jgi:ferritin
MSQIRQNYHEDCEKGINQQINLELYAFYTYTSMVSLHLTSHFLPSPAIMLMFIYTIISRGCSQD